MDQHRPIAFPSLRTVAEAREDLFAEAEDAGAICPCCDQFAKVYRRRIYSTMARQLITAWRAVRDDPSVWFHVPTAVGYGGDICKVHYWGLMEESPAVREDGGKAGWWRFTELGAQWVQGHATVPRYAYVYNGNALRLDGPPATIREALGDKFDLRELMAPAPLPDEAGDAGTTDPEART